MTTTAGATTAGARLWEVATGRQLSPFEVSDRDRDHYTSSVASSPDGRIIACGGSYKFRGDRTATRSRDSRACVWLWEVATGRPLRQLEGSGTFVTSVAFSPDGRTIACGDNDEGFVASASAEAAACCCGGLRSKAASTPSASYCRLLLLCFPSRMTNHAMICKI